jgi:hypothetical protein
LADQLVLVLGADLLDRLDRAQQRNAAARQDALVNDAFA